MTARKTRKRTKWKVWALLEGARLLDVCVTDDETKARAFLGDGSHKIQRGTLTLDTLTLSTPNRRVKA